MRDLSAERCAPLLPTTALARPLPFVGRWILRAGPQPREAAGAALGLAVPAVPCRATVEGARAALWLGPDEWLLLAPEREVAQLATALAAALGGLPHSLVDVSHRQEALELTGPNAALLLAAGCPLDLEASAFPVGMCTRTMLAKAEVVLWRTDAETFRIEVWRSFAPYVSAFLEEAARGIA